VEAERRAGKVVAAAAGTVLPRSLNRGSPARCEKWGYMEVAEASRNGTVHVLLPNQLEDLRKSGLSDDTIRACGFHSVTAKGVIRIALNWERYRGGLGPCLAIPFFDPDGNPIPLVNKDGQRVGSYPYRRLKPDRPRTDDDGKPVKYESPYGVPNLPYFPPGTRAVLQDATIPLLVTEGEKKAAKADQDGFPCIGLVGVDGWSVKRERGANGKGIGERELIPGLAAVAWQGRTVIIVYDSDAVTKPEVAYAEWRLAEALAKHGATVKVIRLPPGDPGSDGTPGKVGLDDFLVAHGPDALRAMLAAATPPAKPEVKRKQLGQLKPNEAPDDPHRLARLFLDEACRHKDGLTLRHWREEWHRWIGSAYRTIAEKELRAELTASVKKEMDRLNIEAQQKAEGKKRPRVRKVTGRLVADVAHALTSMTILSGRVESPAWISGNEPFAPGEVLACKNQLIHLPSLVAGKDYAVAPTPRFFSPNVLGFDFDAKPPAPTVWLDFLARLWPGDKTSIAALQEWTGYLLTPDTRQQKILLLVGPRRSGKGTIARVIRTLVGPDNVAGPTLASLAMNFGLWPLLGKTVAMIQDARLSGRSDVASVTERLLSLSGEDALTVDRKNLSPVTVKLAARFMILSNELPRLTDASGALAGRMVLLRLTQSWYGQEDVQLTDRLLGELPGILWWAIQGWHRLRSRGYFVQPDAGKDLIDELADLASPVGAFVRERCRVGPGCQIERQVLFEAWNHWCEDQGRDHPGDSATFGRNLRAVAPGLGDAQPRTGEGGRVRVYEGICLK
jgi:putative DNA primase/helicase